MKTIACFFLLLTSATVSAQEGYIKLYESDSVLNGYLRYYYPVDGPRGYELWKTKNDKHPRKISMEMISEYAIKKDTFKMFRNYTPFQDSKVYVELGKAKIISRNKIILYELKDFRNPNIIDPKTGYIYFIDENFFIPNKILPTTGQSVFTLYILENKSTGYIRAVSANEVKMKQNLLEFLSERYLLRYEEVKGKLKYKNIPELVKLYNSKP